MKDIPSWLGPRGLEDAQRWLSNSVAGCGELRPVRLQRWSAVFVSDCGDREVYFKAVPHSLRGEVSLTRALWQQRVSGVAQVLAAEPERGWLVTAALQGEVLADTEQTIGDWHKVLEAYAALQRQTTSSPQRWLEAGAQDGGLDKVAELYTLLLDEEPRVNHGANKLTAAELTELRAARPEIVETCRRLKELGAPIGLVHNDLHDGNICHVDKQRFTFFDWGDCFVGPVFADLHLALRVVGQRTGASDEQLAQLQATYLSAWTDDFDTEALSEMAQLAARVAHIFHAMTWLSIAGVPGGESDATGVSRWLRRLLEQL